jgi:phosphopantetheine adenylyltransferase
MKRDEPKQRPKAKELLNMISDVEVEFQKALNNMEINQEVFNLILIAKQYSKLINVTILKVKRKCVF